MKGEDIPKSAKDNWALWNLCKDLSLEEIRVLIGKRKNDIKYEKSNEKIKLLRTDICILEDAYEIIKRRRK